MIDLWERPPVREKLYKKAGNPLMKQLAIPLSNQKTIAKWLVISTKLDVELTIAAGRPLPHSRLFLL